MAPKKTMQFTSRTLWTSPSSTAALDHSNTQISEKVKEHFKKSLAASEQTLKKRLETFEPVDISEAAARSFVK